jgi:hypothetical protein
MNRVITLLLFGLLFWIIFDFIFYSGLMVNYIERYDISIFFNEFFIESQFWWIWPIGILIYGLIFMLKNSNLFKILFYIFSLILAGATWIPDYGDFIGRAIFAKENVSYQFKTFIISDATLLFSSRGLDYVLLPDKKRVIKYPSSYRK